jgi:hypothetical protein
MTDQTPMDDESTSLSREIDQLCDAFEAAWKRGDPPNIEQLLARSPLPLRPRLLRELLHLDLEYRSLRREVPQQEAYAARFPGHENVVEEVYREFASQVDTHRFSKPEPCGTVDENVLLGILALQMDFVTREQFIVAMLAWVKDKSRSLGQIFRDQGVLLKDTTELLSALVAKHLKIK